MNQADRAPGHVASLSERWNLHVSGNQPASCASTGSRNMVLRFAVWRCKLCRGHGCCGLSRIRVTCPGNSVSLSKQTTSTASQRRGYSSSRCRRG
jgi:hypothetical protein